MTRADRVDEALAAIADQRWSGPERDERIERLIREVRHMQQDNSNRYSKRAMIAVGVTALLAGGAIAGAVTHQVMSHRAVLVDSDGNEHQVILTPSQDGASGTFVTDDGTVYGIEMVEESAQKQLTVDMSGAADGDSATVTVEDDGGN
ncbi:MAG: hypothetical protein ACF8Q5_01995 [Phycisphaerales bacterium JB040]